MSVQRDKLGDHADNFWMDPRIGFLQPEQRGPAFNTWNKIWEGAVADTRLQVPDFIPLGTDNNCPPEDGDAAAKNQKNRDQNNGSKRWRSTNVAISTTNTPDKILHSTTVSLATPWISNEHWYPHGVIGLHMEICDFYKFMKSRPAEQAMREDSVCRVRQVVERLWPTAQVKEYGSFKTGLYLPTSDIDIAVFGKWERLPLWTLEKALLANNIAEAQTIKVLDKASVPIIKFTDQETDLKLDISFNVPAGIRAAEFVKENIQVFPCLPSLVLVLKQFLLQRDLNEVFTGGISSYSLILMVISFLQHHPRHDGRTLDSNLGVLLIEFFELYGPNFNYVNTGISVKDGGSYFSKQEVLNGVDQGFNASLLCIEDPFTPGNYIGKSSYAFLNVRSAFNYAYLVLSKAVSKATEKKENSILSRIVRVSRDLELERKEVADSWGTACPATPPVTLVPLPRAPTYASVANKHLKQGTSTPMQMSHSNVAHLLSTTGSDYRESGPSSRADSELFPNMKNSHLLADSVRVTSSKRTAAVRDPNSGAKKGKNSDTSYKGKAADINSDETATTAHISKVPKVSVSSSSGKQTLPVSTKNRETDIDLTHQRFDVDAGPSHLASNQLSERPQDAVSLRMDPSNSQEQAKSITVKSTNNKDWQSSVKSKKAIKKKKKKASQS